MNDIIYIKISSCDTNMIAACTARNLISGTMHYAHRECYFIIKFNADASITIFGEFQN